MSPKTTLWGAATFLAIGALAGCAVSGVASSSQTPPSPSPPMTLSIANETTISVTVVVNGNVVETVPPGGSDDYCAWLPFSGSIVSAVSWATWMDW
jgi:hypothetical protein